MAARAIGVVRVSEVGDRQDGSLHSPTVQAERIRQWCDERGLKLLDTYEELDVSGGRPLDRRPGLGRAVMNVERGQADAIVVAYFNRLVRSMDVQLEVVGRVERAGGDVWTLDFGKITNGTAAERLTANFLGSMSQFQREETREKSAEGQRHAVAAGKFIGPAPPGYVRDGGKLAIDPATVDIARELFERRAKGASYSELREFLARNGIERTVSGVRKMLASRAYLGEVNFGKLRNLEAHPAIIDRELFGRVQRTRVTGGRKSKSDRLLARLDVLHCGTCGGRMSASRSGEYPFYRCTSQACDKPQTIGAEIVERQVRDAVLGVVARFREVVGDIKGAAPVGQAARQARTARDRAQANLAAALRAFSGFENEDAARDKLIELGRIRDEAQARVDQLGDAPLDADDVDWAVLNEPDGWDRLTLDARRKLIRAFIERVSIAPGRGPDRVSISVTVEIYDETQDGS